MLLEFKTKNYKSFQDEMIFSMIPAPQQKGLDYSIFREKIGNKTYKGLCSAVIYGPNAAGKTNMIGAMDTFKSIVLRGNIRNNDSSYTPNAARSRLELIPNNRVESVEPVQFSIKFSTDHLLVEYSFSAELGSFLNEGFPRRIKKEKLNVNGKNIFERGEKLFIGELNNINQFLTPELRENQVSAHILAEVGLKDDELFLTNGFRNIFSAKLVDKIVDWLNNDFKVVYMANDIESVPTTKEEVFVEGTLVKAVQAFGVKSNLIAYVRRNDDSEATLCSVFLDEKKEKSVAIPAKAFESFGTIRFINLFPLVVNAFLSGGTLVIDEFDASIHPMALMNLINIFHNDELNIHHAQLIFNTHNPIFLNSNLFRRDEIKFVEQDDDTHCSYHYSLSDFGTSGPGGVRKNDDYMKNYFVDRYGAIRDIDLTPVFQELLQKEDEE